MTMNDAAEDLMRQHCCRNIKLSDAVSEDGKWMCL